jgi:hypothetical protein
MKVSIDITKVIKSQVREFTKGVNLSTKCTKPSKKTYSRKGKNKFTYKG